MKNYMILNRKYTVEYGTYDATFIDFEKGNYFSLGGEKYELFRTWQKNKTVDTENFTSTEKELYEFLTENGIASFEERFYVSEGFDVGKKFMLYNEKKSPLSRVFIELGKGDFKKKFERITSPCLVCQNNEKISISNEEMYVKLIEELACRGVQQIVMYGGDILNNPSSKVFMKVADESYIQFCLIVDESDVTVENIAQVSEYSTELIITVDFRSIVDIDKIRQIEQKLHEKNVFAKYSVVISSSTISDYVVKECQLSALETEVVNVSYVMEEKITDVELSEICLLKSVNLNEYKIYSSMNPCMAGTLVIDSDLNVIPCAEMKNYIFGKIIYENNKFKYVKNDTEYSIADFWLSGKAIIKECAECSRKHLCMDCRAAEIDYSGNFENRNTKRKCSYMEACRLGCRNI